MTKRKRDKGILQDGERARFRMTDAASKRTRITDGTNDLLALHRPGQRVVVSGSEGTQAMRVANQDWIDAAYGTYDRDISRAYLGDARPIDPDETPDDEEDEDEDEDTNSCDADYEREGQETVNHGRPVRPAPRPKGGKAEGPRTGIGSGEFVGQREGDACTINGAPGTLRRSGNSFVCVPTRDSLDAMYQQRDAELSSEWKK
jgi:hypothetical protein